jgi:hypothetical protein
MKLSRKMKLRRAKTAARRASRRATRRSRRAQRGGAAGLGRIYLKRDNTGTITNITLKGSLEGSTIAATSAGPSQITLSNIPATMGKLANVKFSSFNNGSWTALSSAADRAKVNQSMPGRGGAIVLESGGKIVRRPGAQGIMPAHTRLPAVLPMLTIRNLEAGIFGALDPTGDAANNNTNICIELTFSD